MLAVRAQLVPKAEAFEQPACIARLAQLNQVRQQEYERAEEY
jgi:hypothetical protein